MTQRTSVWANTWGGLTILGAVDSIPLGGAPEEVPDPDAPQGVSTGPRFYNYGPGTNFGGLLNVKRGALTFLTFGYEAHHLHVLDGVRANHLLQRARVDLLVPLRGRLGIGVTGEYFNRRTYYQQPGVERALFQFPQFRLRPHLERVMSRWTCAWMWWAVVFFAGAPASAAAQENWRRQARPMSPRSRACRPSAAGRQPRCSATARTAQRMQPTCTRAASSPPPANR